MRLAAVVICYEFSNEKLYENVRMYLHDVDVMIIWDNTPSNNIKITLDFWSDKHSDIHLLKTGKNEGIGYALNKAAEYARESECTHLLTMDQDSIWRNFSEYRRTVENYNDKDIAIYAPTIADAESDFVFWCNKPDLYAITSGCIFDLEKIHKIGPFNEKFFIDEVDNEYCIRAVQRGYHIKIYENIFLYQHFGSNEGQSFWARQTGNYSAFRTYHQVRNRLWMWRMYPHQLNYRYHLRTLLLTILKRSIVIIAYEKDKKNKLKAICKGIVDGFTKKPI